MAALQEQFGSAKAAYEKQESNMDAVEVSHFKRLVDQIKRSPYIAEITAQNCGGCHMRVSNDCLKKAKMGEIAICDQCSRIVYIDN